MQVYIDLQVTMLCIPRRVDIVTFDLRVPMLLWLAFVGASCNGGHRASVHLFFVISSVRSPFRFVSRYAVHDA